ncbi:hypothetical protein J717_1234 [Acinetobacter baumannii 121738]|nr:hypothetical protein J717_4086 [Acinetobacter baumannii 121738]EXG36266.1 hypothetical protein J717_1234 [Acinetobacter baumannii 121738]
MSSLVVHRIDDLEKVGNARGILKGVVHRIDDLEIVQAY